MSDVACAMVFTCNTIEEEIETDESMGRNRRRNKNNRKRRRARARAAAANVLPWHSRSGGVQLDLSGTRNSRIRNRNKAKYPKYKKHLYATLFYTEGVKDG